MAEWSIASDLKSEEIYKISVSSNLTFSLYKILMNLLYKYIRNGEI
jgi:hypothetical protein